jgi:hypothetical protein
MLTPVATTMLDALDNPAAAQSLTLHELSLLRLAQFHVAVKNNLVLHQSSKTTTCESSLPTLDDYDDYNHDHHSHLVGANKSAWTAAMSRSREERIIGSPAFTCSNINNRCSSLETETSMVQPGDDEVSTLYLLSRSLFLVFDDHCCCWFWP